MQARTHTRTNTHRSGKSNGREQRFENITVGYPIETKAQTRGRQPMVRQLVLCGPLSLCVNYIYIQ